MFKKFYTITNALILTFLFLFTLAVPNAIADDLDFGLVIIDLGDVDCNGDINMEDVTTLQRIIAKLTTHEKVGESSKVNSDVNSDSKVNMSDVTAIQKYLAKLINNFDDIVTDIDTSSDTVIDTNTDSLVDSEIDFATKVIELVNDERKKNGLSPLKKDDSLAKIAQLKAEDMLKLNYFSHQSPTYGSPFDMMKTYGITFKSAAENIANNHKTPEAVMNGWMNSEGHRKNILKPDFTHIGVGQVENGLYWVQMFIER